MFGELNMTAEALEGHGFDDIPVRGFYMVRASAGVRFAAGSETPTIQQLTALNNFSCAARDTTIPLWKTLLHFLNIISHRR
jgi:hypothetical protein